jgi:homopolymeric O-antigen transport system ATP-binding protein
MKPIPSISVSGLSKRYQLGTIGRHTLADECRYVWCKLRGRDPFKEYLGIGDKRRQLTEDERKGWFWALRDATFDVQRGEVLGIIGPNGAGKSTLLKLLTRITEPTEGEATMNGRVASLLEVGTGFHPELTGRENVFMNGTILGMRHREIAQKFDEIVAFSELEKFIDTPVKRYSSGMYVRLAFAVAAHLEPEILLIDEVLAVGDVSFQKRCLGKMGEVARAGRTVLFVSHNMQAVKSLCHSGVVVTAGRVSEKMPVDQAVDCYLGNVIRTATEVPLTERTDRRGSGKVRLTDLDMFFDEKRKGWTIRVAYESPEPQWNHAALRVMVQRTTGEEILRVDSSIVPDMPEDLPGTAQVTIELSPDAVLQMGEYILDVWCQSGKEMLDHVKNACVLHVEGMVPFGWEDRLRSKSPWAIQQKWICKPGSGRDGSV